MIGEYLQISLKSLRSRGLRSWLTVIGIIIGITALISLITLGEGLQNALTQQFDKFGTNRVMIGPKVMFGAPSGTSTLTEKDVKTLESLYFIDYVTPMLSNVMELTYNNKETFKSVFGIGTKDIEKSFSDVDITLESGRFLEEGERGSAILGYKAANDFFDKQIRVKNKIKINDKDFRVIGIFEEQGNNDDDSRIMISIEDMRDLMNEPTAVSAITATIKEGVDIDEASEKIERRLEKSRDDENFQVTNPKKLQEQTNQILGVVTWVLAGIAFISLLVGGIGIMNSMYTSVLERTREIGVMKAIGAKNSDILTMFLIEAGFLGFVGGVIGITFGMGIAYMVDTIVHQLGYTLIKVKVSYSLMLFGLLFAFIVGIISGTLPAYRASQLKPVDALRYE